VGEKMAKGMLIETWMGMWMGTAVMLPLSIFLTYKATKEATLVDKDAYILFFQKLLRALRIAKKTNGA
jgi:lipopolysaccharide export system permease protein